MQRFDLMTLKQALEGNDAPAMAALFADKATLRIIDSAHPPSRPLELSGRDEIAEFYREVCGRDVTHRLTDAVANEDHLAFTEECEYPNGSKVFCSAMLELDSDGQITREVMVQAWDGGDEKMIFVA